MISIGFKAGLHVDKQKTLLLLTDTSSSGIDIAFII